MHGFLSTGAAGEITQQLQATSTQTQLSLTAALIGLGLGQLFFGPLSDRIGRLKPLALSLLLFIFSSAMCALTRDINMLIVWRFFTRLCRRRRLGAVAIHCPR